MRQLNLDQLRTLIAIADLGTFAAAAQALHLAPPTVSLHVKELESWLDTPLVIRGRRLAELTPAGAVLCRTGASCWPLAMIWWTACAAARLAVRAWCGWPCRRA